MSVEQQFRVAFPGSDLLGEAPCWDEVRQCLLRVDIRRGMVHIWDPKRRKQETIGLEPPVSFAIPTESGDLVVGGRHEIRIVDSSGEHHVIAWAERGQSDNRFNDAKCDRAGRLWAGTMSTVRQPSAGALYRIAPSGEVERVLSGTTISNGLDWSPSADQMYFVDSPTQRIDVLDFDLDTGQISDRRPFATIEEAAGLPDGLVVDREGCVWVALFGGGALRRYGPDGALEEQADLPVSNPTCPAFGNPGLDVLYVTTARHRLRTEQLAREPDAGALFALAVGASGVPPHRFGR